MKSDKNIDLIIELINQFPYDLTEKLKLNKLNEELKKKGNKTISRTTYYKLKRNYPQVFISNKNSPSIPRLLSHRKSVRDIPLHPKAVWARNAKSSQAS